MDKETGMKRVAFDSQGVIADSALTGKPWMSDAELDAILLADADTEYERIIAEKGNRRGVEMQRRFRRRWTAWSGIAAACAVVAAVIVLWPVGERDSETEIAQTTAQTEDLDVVELGNVSETEKLAGEKSDGDSETVAKPEKNIFATKQVQTKPVEKQTSTVNDNRKLLALNNNKGTTNETDEIPENTDKGLANPDERLKNTGEGLGNPNKKPENPGDQSENTDATLADADSQSSTLDDITPCNDIRCMAVIKTLRMLMALNNIPILEEDGEEVFNITQLALAMRPEEINRMTISAVYDSRTFTELRSNAAISGLVAKEIGTRDMKKFNSVLSAAKVVMCKELNVGNSFVVDDTRIIFKYM